MDISLKTRSFINEVRFIDEFVFSKGKLERQQVWNDMAINKLINHTYPLPKYNKQVIKKKELIGAYPESVLNFVFFTNFLDKNLKIIFAEDNFKAILPGKKIFLEIGDFIFYLLNETKYSEKKISEIYSIEKDQSTVVYLTGSISGTNSEKLSFNDIRFIERLEFKRINGKIFSYELWNDLAEHGF